MASKIPKVCYKLKGDPREEFKCLFGDPDSQLRDKNLGIRVFYFNEALKNCATCDHVHSEDYSEEWKAKLEGGEAAEAGTTVDISDYKVKMTTDGQVEKQQHFMVVIQWDCGFVKSYTEAEFNYLRVFDLGPTGRQLKVYGLARP